MKIAKSFCLVFLVLCAAACGKFSSKKNKNDHQVEERFYHIMHNLGGQDHTEVSCFELVGPKTATAPAAYKGIRIMKGKCAVKDVGYQFQCVNPKVDVTASIKLKNIYTKSNSSEAELELHAKKYCLAKKGDEFKKLED